MINREAASLSADSASHLSSTVPAPVWTTRLWPRGFSCLCLVSATLLARPALPSSDSGRGRKVGRERSTRGPKR